jgi:hypothetical protein
VVGRLEALSRGSPEDILREGLEAGRPRTVGDTLAESGLPEAEGREALAELVRRSEVLILGVDETPGR